MEASKNEADTSNVSNSISRDDTPEEAVPADVPLQKELTLSPNELDGEEAVYPHGLKLVVILAALCLAVFLVALDQTIIATAIPKITDQFNSIQDIGWYGSAYLLTTTALQPTFGRIYTIFSVSKQTYRSSILRGSSWNFTDQTHFHHGHCNFRDRVM